MALRNEPAQEDDSAAAAKTVYCQIIFKPEYLDALIHMLSLFDDEKVDLQKDVINYIEAEAGEKLLKDPTIHPAVRHPEVLGEFNRWWSYGIAGQVVCSDPAHPATAKGISELFAQKFPGVDEFTAYAAILTAVQNKNGTEFKKEVYNRVGYSFCLMPESTISQPAEKVIYLLSSESGLMYQTHTSLVTWIPWEELPGYPHDVESIIRDGLLFNEKLYKKIWQNGDLPAGKIFDCGWNLSFKFQNVVSTLAVNESIPDDGIHLQTDPSTPAGSLPYANIVAAESAGQLRVEINQRFQANSMTGGGLSDFGSMKGSILCGPGQTRRADRMRIDIENPAMMVKAMKMAFKVAGCVVFPITDIGSKALWKIAVPDDLMTLFRSATTPERKQFVNDVASRWPDLEKSLFENCLQQVIASGVVDKDDAKLLRELQKALRQPEFYNPLGDALDGPWSAALFKEKEGNLRSRLRACLTCVDSYHSSLKRMRAVLDGLMVRPSVDAGASADHECEAARP